MMWTHLLVVCLMAELRGAERQTPLKANSWGSGGNGWNNNNGNDNNWNHNGGWDSASGSSGGWDSDSGSSGGWDSDSGSSGGWDSDSGSSGGWDSDSGSSGGWDSSGSWDSDSGSNADNDCPDDSVRSGNKCYFTGNAAQYTNAITSCTQQGGRIATFEDENSIATVAQDIAPLLDRVWGTIFWVGLRYRQHTWSWEFDGSRQDVDYNWMTGEKNNYQWDEKCAGMSLIGWLSEMKWSSYHCTWNYPVLCVKGDSTDHCDDVTCPENALCIETAGLAQCVCDAGYTAIYTDAGMQCSHGTCPEDSVRSGNDCYFTRNGGHYTNAMNSCTESGGRIATFEDEDSMARVAHDIAPMLDQMWQTFFWVGMRHRNNRWLWEFDDSNQDITYSWKQGERDNWRWDENCAVMSLIGSRNEMTWSSYHCTWNHAVLCIVGDAPDVHHCNTVTCPAHAHCVEGATSGQCVCDAGYATLHTGTGLQCTLSNVCQASGDPHYTTWDGARLHYQGLCRHLFAGVCGDNVPASMVFWEVRVNNVRRGSNQQVAWTEYAEVSVHGYVIRLGLQQQLLVDGLPRSGRVSLNDDAVTVSLSNNGELVLITDFGLRVTYKNYRITVVSPTEYANHVCGLCGDWDSDRQNDYEIDLTAYQEEDYVGVEGCEISTGNPTDTCPAALLASAGESCTEAIHNTVHLESCRDNPDVSFNDFHEDCVEDICAGGEEGETICSTLEALAAVCQDSGTPVDNLYRVETDCNFDCPANSVYNEDMSLDVATCQNREADYPVSLGNGEGCECLDGYVLEGLQCIDPTECGCVVPFDDPIYLTNGELIVSPDCTTMYICEQGTLYEIPNGHCVQHSSCVLNAEIGLNNCECDTGYSGDGFNECLPVTDCTHLFDGIEVIMVTGQSITTSYCSTVTCTEGQTSETMNCVTNAECNSVEGESVCQCRDGYSGDGTVQCDLITSCEYSNNGNAITMEDGSSLINSDCMEVTCSLGQITTATTSECVDHATCNDGQCDCDEGYSGSGTTECVQTFCTYNFDGVDTTMQSGESQWTSDCTIVSCDDAQISESDSQCVDNAECNLVTGSYTCECEDGYAGDGTDICVPMSCQYTDNGSSQTIPDGGSLVNSNCVEVTCSLGQITTATTSECVDHATCNDGQCDCDEGYSGSGTTECVQTFCTYNFDGVDTTMQSGESQWTSDCTIVSCDDAQISESDSQCVDNAECNLVSGTYTCECEDGYAGDGTDHCAPTSCHYTDNGSSQTLPDGGSRINSNCMEVTCELGEITTATTSECVDHATCNDGQCDCDEGYSGSGTTECVQTFCTYNFDGVDTTMQSGDSQWTSDCTIVSCDDAQISESDSQCVDNAECNLVSGSYTCECEDGYAGDGTDHCVPMSCQYTDNGSSQTIPNGGSIINSNCEEVTCSLGQVAISEPICAEHATCAIGQCACDDGYEGDGLVNCNLILECFYTVDTEVEMQNGSTLTNSQCQTVTCTDGQTTEGDVLCGTNADCEYLDVNTYVCDCINGFIGDPYSECTPLVLCQAIIDGNFIELQDGESVMNSICQEVVCDSTGTTLTAPVCVDHAECVPVDSDQFYQCSCEEGYSGQGDTHCILDECVGVECPENAHCVTGNCECEPGFTPVNTDDGLTCVSSAICQATGDPHYTTWDGVRTHYQGMCRHLLAGVCGNTTLEHWTVMVNNIRLPGSTPSVSFSEYAEVTVYGHVIRLARERVLIIDGTPTTQNYVSLEGGKIVVRYAPRAELRLSTDFGLVVRQRGFRSTVIAPTEYANHVCGICGDWDGNRANDNGRDLSVFQEPESVGVDGCNIPTVDPTDNCTSEVLVTAEATCNLIYDLESLVQCMVLPDSPHGDFFDDCVDDICAGGDPMEVVCETLEAFVVVCEELTQTVINGIYRLESGCGYDCPPNSTYRSEMNLDQPTCDNPDADYDLDFNSGEGCECDDGFVFEGDECVEEEECGCPLPLANPSYLPTGDSYLNENCTTLYECDEAGNLNITDLQCVENASCVQDDDFIRECVCDEGYTGDGFEECEEDDEGNGDPHFIVTSHDQYHTKLCYDVNGNDGDVLLIIRDEENKLEINGEIYQRKNMKHPQAFFNNIAVFYGDVKVIASRTDITINDENSFTWTDSFTAPLSDDVEASVSSGRVPVVEIDLSSDIHLEITRTKTAEGDYFLGIMITHSNGLSDQTTGVMGDFLKSSFKAVTLNNNDNFVEFLDRSLTIPVQKVKRYSRVGQGQVDCWHYTVNTREMQDDLLGDRESYTVPTLNYKPF